MILGDSELTQDKQISFLQDFPKLTCIGGSIACHVPQAHLTMESLCREHPMEVTYLEQHCPRQIEFFTELILISVL